MTTARKILTTIAAAAGGDALALPQTAEIVFRYRADQEVYTDTSRTTPAVDTNIVAGWGDISGNANHMSEVSASNGLTLVSDFGSSGFAALQKDALGEGYVNNSDITWNTYHTTFIVARTFHWVGTQNIIVHRSGSSNRKAYGRGGAANTAFDIRDSGGTRHNELGTGDYVQTQEGVDAAVILAFRYDGALAANDAHEIWVNNTAQGSVSSSGTPRSDEAIVATVRLFLSNASSADITMGVHEVLGWDVPLSDAEITEAFNFLNDSWGMGI